MQDSRPVEPGSLRVTPAWRVVVCTGPRCSAHRSADLAQQLRDRIRRSGLAARVDLSEAAGICHHRCRLGPNLFVSPGDSWYSAVTASDLDEIVDNHLGGGRPVARLLGRQPSFLQLEGDLPW